MNTNTNINTNTNQEQQPKTQSKIVKVSQQIPQNQRDATHIKIGNKNVIACWLLILTQLFYCFMYGFYLRIYEVKVTTSEDFVSISLLFVLIIAGNCSIILGFGLTLVRSYNLAWSSLGFNLLITAISAQTFFLVNAFWSKAGILVNGISSPFNAQPSIIYLTPNSITTQTHATLVQALKCSLSCIVAFSFIIGRAGILQLYFVSILGTIIYQLARQTCLNNFPYEIGTIKIFLFGGVFGMLVSLMLAKLGKQENIVNHYNNWKNRPSIIISLVGIIVVWALFPLLSIQVITLQNTQTVINRVFSVVLAMSSAGLLSTFIAYQYYGFQMITYSVLGAGVAILSSSAYISNPVYVIVFGIASTIFQLLFLMISESYLNKAVGPLDPHAFVFIGQGLIGIFYQTINRQIVQTNSNSLSFYWLYSKKPQYILGNGAITIGFGLLLGFLLGTLFACCPYHKQDDHFVDWTYWARQDGIKTEQVQQKQQAQNFVYVKQLKKQIKQQHAYL